MAPDPAVYDHLLPALAATTSPDADP
jgi:hypothetical protein